MTAELTREERRRELVQFMRERALESADHELADYYLHLADQAERAERQSGSSRSAASPAWRLRAPAVPPRPGLLLY